MKHDTHTSLTTLAALAVSLLVTGCASGENYSMPVFDLPGLWHASETKALPAQVAETSETPAEKSQPWWSSFHDNDLSALVEKALANNQNRKIAEARILEARASRQSTASALYPQVGATGAASRGNNFGVPTESPASLYRLGFDASYEVDFFGGNQRRVEAADADVEASEAEYRHIGLTLVAEVASEYIAFRQLQHLLDLTRKTVNSQRKLHEITRAKKEGGTVSDFDVSQSLTLLKTTSARIPELERQLEATSYRLSTLLGEVPGAIQAELREMKPVPVAQAFVVLESPTEVIRGRPDIQSAERKLAAAAALTGAAISEMYPRITLSSLFGIQTTSLTGGGGIWSLGASVFAPLINFGRIEGQIRASEARQAQAFHAYKQTVLEALSEVETALSNINKENRTRMSLQEAVDSASRTVNASRIRYQTGATDFSEVLQSEQQLYDVKSQLVTSDARVSAYMITLCKALALNM
jgi:multidrug efflux system outer membrane protein